MSKLIIVVIALFFIGAIANSYYVESKVSIVKNCKVEKLQQQNLIKGSGSNMRTEIRYLIITDKETFICKSSTWNSKYNNSDLFFHLKEGNNYTFKVSGVGKSYWYDYRNILEVIK